MQVVETDTYRFTHDSTVWPYVALSRGDSADKLLSIWSPNVPHDPLFPQPQYLPGIGCCWLGQGSCTASSRRVHVTKINRKTNADVTFGQCQGSGSRSVEVWHNPVQPAVLSEERLLTTEIALQQLSAALTFFFFPWDQNSLWRLPLTAKIKKVLCCCLKGNRPDVHLLRKGDVILDVNVHRGQNPAPLVSGSWFS